MGSMQPPFRVSVRDHPLMAPRKLKVICIGAGFSGLLLAYRVKHMDASKFMDLTIFEKNPGIGGTWYENRYPGAACDVPSHIYTFPFAPNPNWSTLYVTAPEILAYMQNVTERWQLGEYVQLNTKVISCIWSDEDGQWSVIVEKDGIVTEHRADILVNGAGVLNQPSMPKIDGLDTFGGDMMHSARWNQSIDFKDKRVAVIGNGSSAIQIVPQLQREVRSLVEYVRTPVWITPNLLGEFSPNGDDFNYTEEQKQRFRDNPLELRDLRRKIEHAFNSGYPMFFKDSPQQAVAKAEVVKHMRTTLAGRDEYIARLIPDFALGCGRPNPGYGYLESLLKSNVRVAFDPIKNISPKGIVSTRKEPDGTSHDVEDEFDIVVCATGFDTSFQPRWEMFGRNGTSLKKLWSPDAEAYLSICAPEMPNYFIFNGPNCPFGSGSFLGSMDATADYIVRFCRKIAENDIKSACVKPDVVREYNDYVQEFMKKTVYSGACRTWYKNHQLDGRVTAQYAGSALHFRQMLLAERWEDFDFTYRSQNRFQMMGSGFTQHESDGGPLGDYLML